MPHPARGKRTPELDPLPHHVGLTGDVTEHAAQTHGMVADAGWLRAYAGDPGLELDPDSLEEPADLFHIRCNLSL